MVNSIKKLRRTQVFDGFKTYVGLDIETSNLRGGGSLDYRSGAIALIQLNINDEEIKLLRPTKENLEFIRGLVHDPTTLTIGHNLSFDMKWLADVGVFPYNVFDTQIASELYYAGYSHVDEATAEVTKIKKAVHDNAEDELFDIAEIKDLLGFKKTKQSKFAHNLATVLYRELGVLIPKEMQNSDWMREPLSPLQKEYAENDVRYLIKLARVLAEKIQSAGLTRTFLLEMEAIFAITFMEFVGVQVDAEEWKRKTEELRKELMKKKKELEEEFGRYLAEKEGNYGLFGLVPKKVNLNSPLQMAEILGLKDVRADTLKNYAGEDEKILKFIEYKKLEKLVSTYGDAYLKRVGKDGRLRGNFTQTAVATGRLSSRNPNLQNVPPDFIKSMIRARKGYIPITADYSQVELRILAYLSGDKNFIEATKSSDLHAATARMIFNIPDNEPVPSELRRKAKTVNFGIPYGISAAGLVMRGFFKDIEDAEKALISWRERFSTAWKFLEESGERAVRYGESRDAIGRIRRYLPPEKPKHFDETVEHIRAIVPLLKEFEVSLFDLREFSTPEEICEEYRSKLGNEFCQLVFAVLTRDWIKRIQEVKKYEAQLNAIRRQAQNMPIQSTSASITKQALADLYVDMLQYGRYIFTLSVHDSIFGEVEEKDAVKHAQRIKRIMEEAGPKIVPGIITPVDLDYGYKKEYKCVQCGKPVLKFNLYEEDGALKEVDPNTVLCEDCAKS